MLVHPCRWEESSDSEWGSQRVRWWCVCEEMQERWQADLEFLTAPLLNAECLNTQSVHPKSLSPWTSFPLFIAWGVWILTSNVPSTSGTVYVLQRAALTVLFWFSLCKRSWRSLTSGLEGIYAPPLWSPDTVSSSSYLCIILCDGFKRHEYLVYISTLDICENWKSLSRLPEQCWLTEEKAWFCSTFSFPHHRQQCSLRSHMSKWRISESTLNYLHAPWSPEYASGRRWNKTCETFAISQIVVLKELPTFQLTLGLS